MIYKIILLLDFSEQYSRDIFKGIKTYAKSNGTWLFNFMPVHQQTIKGIDGILQWANEWGANGVIGQFYNLSKSDIAKFKKSGIAIISQDFKERLEGLPVITGAYRETGKLAAEYFARKGFRNFGFYGFSNIVWSRERLEGFREALSEKGFVVHNLEQEELPTKELWQYQPDNLMQWLSSLPKPIAIMACDDNQGQYICEVCRLLNIRIPEDVAILGVDNDQSICEFSNPPLSSIKQNAEKGGYDAAASMQQMIDSRTFHCENIYVPYINIITRQSTDIYTTQDPVISDLLRYIHTHINTKINVQKLLKEIPISRRKLEKKFFTATHTSIYQYILHLKMEKFTERLLETNDSLVNVATELGLDDYKNISRTFKKLYGCAPNKYRQQNQTSSFA